MCAAQDNDNPVKIYIKKNSREYKEIAILTYRRACGAPGLWALGTLGGVWVPWNPGGSGAWELWGARGNGIPGRLGATWGLWGTWGPWGPGKPKGRGGPGSTGPGPWGGSGTLRAATAKIGRAQARPLRESSATPVAIQAASTGGPARGQKITIFYEKI